VQGDVGALTGQWRRQLLEAVSAPLVAATLAGAADRDVLALVEAQQLREGQLQAGGDLLPTARVGLSPRSTWDSIGALTPLRSARSRRRTHRLAQDPYPSADRGGAVARPGRS
jgi:hypothetical protein